MKESHGNLENEILNAVWKFEENKCETNISVNDVYNILNASTVPRAYTTIKTVMDRLVEKKLLVRNKMGKKYCYNSTISRYDMARTAIEKLAKQYFYNDMKMLRQAIEKECLQTVG